MDQWISKSAELEGLNYILEQKVSTLEKENQELKKELAKLYDTLIQLGFTISKN